MDNIVRDLEPMLRELAEKLGTTSEYLWTIMIKQAFIYGASYIGFFIFMTIISICLVLFGREITKRVNIEDCDKRINENWHFAWAAPLAFMGVIIFISLAVDAVNIITAFINPEYWALKEILYQIN